MVDNHKIRHYVPCRPVTFGSGSGGLLTGAGVYSVTAIAPSEAPASANLYITDVTSLELSLLFESSVLVILKEK